MTDQPTPEQQLAAIRRKMAAPSPAPEQIAQWNTDDRVMADRIHAARPGVRTHHVFAALQTLRTILWLDKAGEEPTPVPAEPLVQVGWYCWRCQAINAQPCRSDAVPVHVPADWADDMREEIAKRDEEDDDEPAPVPDSSRTTADNCPGYETDPNTCACACACEGCKHNCAAHQQPDRCGTCHLPPGRHSAACPEGRRLRQRDRSDAVPAQGNGYSPAQLLGADNPEPRDLYEAAIEDAVYQHREMACQWQETDGTTQEIARRATGAVLAVRDPAMEQLRADLQFEREQRNDIRRRLGETSNAYSQMEDERDTARAAIDRVRALHTRANHGSGDVCTYCSTSDYPNYEVRFPCQTIAALNQPGDGPADTPCAACDHIRIWHNGLCTCGCSQFKEPTL